MLRDQIDRAREARMAAAGRLYQAQRELAEARLVYDDNEQLLTCLVTGGLGRQIREATASYSAARALHLEQLRREAFGENALAFGEVAA